jgi:hypothetical protein
MEEGSSFRMEETFPKTRSGVAHRGGVRPRAQPEIQMLPRGSGGVGGLVTPVRGYYSVADGVPEK